MTTHSLIEGSFLGVATSIRRWFSTRHTKWHTEVNLGKFPGYFTLGCDLFCHDEAVMLHLRLFPLWISLSFTADWEWLKRLRERVHGKGYQGRQIGVTYMEACLSWEFWKKEHESSTRDPWWYGQSFYMPWHPLHIYVAVLSQDLKTIVHMEHRRDRKKKRWDSQYEESKKSKALVALSAPYTYTLKNGEVQHRIATYFVERRAWGYRWLPLPFHVRTCIDVAFDGEVGERSGSWKGGTVGCGYGMLPGETPLETLRRMERERKF